MADDNDDWFSSTAEEEPAPASPAAAAAGAAAPGGAPAAEAAPGEAPAEAPGEEKREEAEDEVLDPDKLILFKHWIRPKFLQYQYLYEYRKNYYQDVLDVLERRRKGYKSDIPKPRTWGERVLSIYNDPIKKVEAFEKSLDDLRLITRTRISGEFHSYYLRNTSSKRYSLML